MNIKDPNKILFANKKKKKVKILLDLDGVCSDWLHSACKLFDIDLDHDEKIRNHFLNDGDLEDLIGEDKMWKRLRKEEERFNRDMNIYPWAKDLCERLKKLGNLAICTSPGNVHKYPKQVGLCCYGKCLWVSENMPDIPLILVRDKSLCAAPKTILIDDSEKHKEDFEKNGGTFYLWPNPIKIENDNSILEDVISEIEEIVNEMRY